MHLIWLLIIVSTPFSTAYPVQVTQSMGQSLSVRFDAESGAPFKRENVELVRRQEDPTKGKKSAKLRAQSSTPQKSNKDDVVATSERVAKKMAELQKRIQALDDQKKAAQKADKPTNPPGQQRSPQPGNSGQINAGLSRKRGRTDDVPSPSSGGHLQKKVKTTQAEASGSQKQQDRNEAVKKWLEGIEKK